MTLLHFIVSELDEKQKAKRADQWIAAQEGLPSRSQLKIWFDEGRITRRSAALQPSDKLVEGDEIWIDVPPPKSFDLDPRPMDLDIFFEDEDLIVLYKPRGLPMHPGASKSQVDTLVHALLAHSEKLSTQGGSFRPGIVHRLDKDTEGLVVVAKNNETHEKLSKQFSERSIRRSYWALCRGKFPAEMKVEAPIGRHPSNRKKMAVRPDGREAISHFERVQYFDEGYSWVRCRLRTGRTHQIRVHLSYKKFPILNDPVYASAPWRGLDLSEEKRNCLAELAGQALLAYELGFIHPRTKETLHFEARMPHWLKCLTEI